MYTSNNNKENHWTLVYKLYDYFTKNKGYTPWRTRYHSIYQYRNQRESHRFQQRKQDEEHKDFSMIKRSTPWKLIHLFLDVSLLPSLLCMYMLCLCINEKHRSVRWCNRTTNNYIYMCVSICLWRERMKKPAACVYIRERCYLPTSMYTYIFFLYYLSKERGWEGSDEERMGRV